MFITKKHLSRRTFLRGAGVTLTLPFLEAMVPAQTPLVHTAANPNAKFGFIYVPMGSIMKQWTPEQEGAGFEFSPILKPLEPFRNNVIVVTGLHNSGEPGHSVRKLRGGLSMLLYEHFYLAYADSAVADGIESAHCV